MKKKKKICKEKMFLRKEKKMWEENGLNYKIH